MKLSIAGPPGSGKSTVAKLLAERLDLQRYYVGGIQRELAQKHGMTIERWNEYCAQHKEADQEIEDYQERLGKTEDNFVIEGRTSFHFIPNSIKIYIDVDLVEAARRVLKNKEGLAGRNEEEVNSLEEKTLKMQERKANESRRYMEHYGIDVHNKSNFDIVVDSTHYLPDQVVQKILDYLKGKGHI